MRPDLNEHEQRQLQIEVWRAEVADKRAKVERYREEAEAAQDPRDKQLKYQTAKWIESSADSLEQHIADTLQMWKDKAELARWRSG